ncbi:protein mono-ADP-ribosyltransferase PARP4 isoform X3 [Xenopus laevis]|uniref:Poly [ADP-ribose] polymerase n=1 Tax=Xenopus laevis TaxID=8355 RepID=A0A8J1MA81_XENLA|nr:protein mono-ADP-ribosyltransferase PARP4 isoform X3 [Xenopus laevis]
MTVAIFSDCVFFLKINDLSFKERKALKFTITSNGGVISFVLNQKCTHVVVNTIGCLSASQQKNVQKHRIQIVDSHFIWKCLEEKSLIHDYQYPTAGVQPSETKSQSQQADPEKAPALQNKDELMDSDHSEYDAETFIDPPDTEVAKYCFFHKGFNVAFLELLCFPESSSFLFKISKVICNSNGAEPDKSFHFANTAEAACNKYEKCSEDLKKQGFKSRERIPAKVALQTSEALQKVLLEEAINATKLSADVGYFVETVWTEALGHLDNILSCPVNSISLNDVSKAEGVLLQARKALDTGTEPRDIMNAMVEFYRLIPHKIPMLANVNKKFLSTKQDLCQVIRDMVSVCETNLSKPNPSSLAKYQALRCQIEHVDPDTEEFHQVSQQIMENKHCEESVNILKIFRIGKLSEATGFQRNLGNVKSLLHASSPCHFVGILSRGLLLPKNVEDDLGLERTDIGNLGSGVYFGDSISTSVKYSEPSLTNGARHLLVCDVALGNSKDLYKRDFSLTEAPSGFDSVHGVRQVPGRKSDFEDDEFVVYSKDQVKMKYVVQFCTAKDQVNMEHDKLPVQVEPMEEDVGEESVQAEDPALESLPEPQSVKGGLQSVHGNQIPLENIHVKGRIMDLVAEVILFQTYINQSSVPIEAKYVFPLDSTAAVCGFEAFINGKHVIGEVKEKKQAHQEYRAAIREGHGAYLMDQDAADIFTVSVGNLPPNATVIIKITYITELNMNYRTVDFKLPGTVASWQKDKALKENTQDTVEKICVEESGVPKGCFSLEMSVEMCFKITSMMSYTHEILMKKTDCKAVIATKKGSSLNEEGFELAVALESNFADSSWNQPRMWVEKHPDEESEACMLVFLPSFETHIQSWDLTILLDCSNSMESTFQSAKRIALLAAGLLNTWHNVNIINFGTSYKEFSIRPKENNSNALTEVEQFIKLVKPNMGNTELWKPLQSLCLLAPSGGTMHNVLLISDGHVQNESRVFQILKKNAGKVRLFTCGVGSTANRHMLRCLAQYGAGFFEFFEDKSKSSWKKKMEAQLEKMDSPACTSASVKWMQFSENEPEPVQAPAHIPALFNRSCLLVYGFAPRCTQAKLQALIDDKELDTVVSTTELQKTRGTMLHKLTARAIIKDYEDGILHEKEHEHEMKKQQTKSFIIELSKKYSIVTQFTSFVAVEKRDAQEKPKDYVPNVLEIISAEVVDILPYMTWETQKEEEKAVVNVLNGPPRYLFTKYTELTPCKDILKFLDCNSSANDILHSDDFFADGTPDCFSDCIEEQAEMKLIQDGLRIAGDALHSASVTPKSSSVFDMPSRLEHQLQQRRPPGAPRIMQRRQCVISTVTKASPSIMQMHQCVSSDVSKAAAISSVSEASPTFSFGTAGLARSAVSEAVRTFSSGTAGFKSFHMKAVAQSNALSSAATSSGFLGSASGFGVNTAAQSSGLMGSPPGFSFALPPQPPLAAAQASISPSYEEARWNQRWQPGQRSCRVTAQEQVYELLCRKEEVQMPKTLLRRSAFAMPHMALQQQASMPSKRARTRPSFLTLSALQCEEGYWLLNEELGSLLNINVNYLIDEFLSKNGIQSLGRKGKEEVLKMIATLLVLQVICTFKLVNVTFKSLMKLDESCCTSPYYQTIEKSTKWARKTDDQYPGICSRLGLGKDWESATRKLLSIDPLDPSSSLLPAVV